MFLAAANVQPQGLPPGSPSEKPGSQASASEVPQSAASASEVPSIEISSSTGPSDRLVAGDVMSSPVVTIPAETSVADAVRDYFSGHRFTVYPVVSSDRILGLLTAAGIEATPAVEAWTTTAGRAAGHRQPALIADETTPLADVCAAFSANPEQTARVLVRRRGRLVGIISPNDILGCKPEADG